MDLILMTAAMQPTAEVLPALGLLQHTVTVLPLDAAALVDHPAGDLVLVDARRELAGARPVDDIVLDTAGPAELDARLRLAVDRKARTADATPEHVNVGALSIDETTYSARLEGRPLDLTYKEFELLKFLAQHPGRVFSRSHLVQEVWGYDYFGGTRTVDVHVRRLRAKLGPEHEALIGTVRNVGYKFVRPAADTGSDGSHSRVADNAVDDTDVITR